MVVNIIGQRGYMHRLEIFWTLGTGAESPHLVVVPAVLVGLRRPKVVQLPELGVQDLLQLRWCSKQNFLGLAMSDSRGTGRAEHKATRRGPACRGQHRTASARGGTLGSISMPLLVGRPL